MPFTNFSGIRQAFPNILERFLNIKKGLPMFGKRFSNIEQGFLNIMKGFPNIG